MKRIISVLLTLMLLCGVSMLPAAALDLIPEERTQDLVVDEAGVLTPDELASLNSNALTIEETWEMDVAVAIVPSLDGKSAMDYADDYYDYNGYGYGMNDDGILLLISVGDREYWMTCYGRGSESFSPGRRDHMAENFTAYLADNDWGGAANSFLRDANRYLEKDGTPPHVPFIAIPLCLLGGFLLGGAPVAGMKAKHKQVRQKYDATHYVTNGKSLFAVEKNIFLHETVSRVPIQRETKSGDRSAHTSSSGRTHTGSGGKF